MPRLGTMGAVLALPLMLLGALFALPGAEAAEGIAFLDDLPKAYDKAKADDKPLMICVNSKRVDGKFRLEPAAKELRENTYKAAEIAKLAERFVCVIITGDSTSEDFGELRARYKLDGDFISPQHIFAYPNGKLIFREEHWPYGTGGSSVRALKTMMEKALTRDAEKRGQTSPTPEGEKKDGEEEDASLVPAAPEDPEKRAAWLDTVLPMARSPDEDIRREALLALLDADKEGDVVAKLVAMMDELKKETFLLADFIRAFGRDGLEPAREAVEAYLVHKEDMLRANAAVSLEYIGSKESISPLIRAAKREKDQGIMNHMYRALGRCGAGESKVRGILAKRAQGGKSNFATYGAIIGLSYFEEDKKAAREVEKLLKKSGVPSGRRGGWRGGGKRSLLTWTLAEIRQIKSAKFLRNTMVPMVGDSRWAGAIVAFYEAAASYIEGSDDAMGDVEAGVDRALGGGRGQLQDEARQDRENLGFQPKGEFQGGARG